MDFLLDISVPFVLGLLTPLGAVCILPLYPAFVAALSNQLSREEPDPKIIVLFGLVMSSGVTVFMFLLGLLFTTILQVSLTQVIGIVSPIAFGILIIISMFLLLNIDVGKLLPRIRVPSVKGPLLGGFIRGFFFGAIVIPCNPLFIATMFARTLLSLDFLGNILKFLLFGIGMAFPLLVFALISTAASKAIVGFLTTYKRFINLAAGVIMLPISVYYLVFVFRIFGG
jgi:cytochrome c-type biogenesis protein